MGDSVDGTLQPPSIGNTSMTWNPSFVVEVLSIHLNYILIVIGDHHSFRVLYLADIC